MAMVPVICDDCGTIWGAPNVFEGDVRNLLLSGNKVSGCPRCGGWGSIPDGAYNLIDDTLQVVQSAGLPPATLQSLIGLLEAHAKGNVSDDEVFETVEAEAPDLAATIKDYLGKTDPVSWLNLLLTILLMMLQPAPPSAEEVADAVWAKEHPAQAAPRAPGAPQRAVKPKRTRPPKTHGKTKQRKPRRPR